MRTVKTSDNTTYFFDTEEQLETIKKNCADNSVKLFDENGQEILIQVKKTKE